MRIDSDTVALITGGASGIGSLARGFLAGNRDRDGGGPTDRAKNDPVAKSIYFRQEDFELQELLGRIGATHEISLMQVALAWFSSRPADVVPIVGVTKPKQLEKAIALRREPDR